MLNLTNQTCNVGKIAKFNSRETYVTCISCNTKVSPNSLKRNKYNIYTMFVTSSVLFGSGSLGKSGNDGRFFRPPPPHRNLLRKELPLSPAFLNTKITTSYDIKGISGKMAKNNTHLQQITH